MTVVQTRQAKKRLVKTGKLKVSAIISNSNWIEWSTIPGVIVQVISKSDKRKARQRFEITSVITP